MREAFTYMFKDPGYSQKATKYFIVCFFALALMATPEITNSATPLINQSTKISPTTNPLFLLLPILGWIFNFILEGYFFTCIQAIAQQNKNIILPFLKPWNSFLRGLKYNFSLLLITILFFIIGAASSFAGPIAMGILAIFLIIFFGAWGMGFMWLFACENKVSTYFSWKKVAKLVQANRKTYFKNLSVAIIITFVGFLTSSLFMLLFNFLVNNAYIAWILTSIEGAIIASYVAFVTMYLTAKSIEPESVV